MERKKDKGKEVRIIPLYNRSNEFKKRLRDKYLQNWPFASHWVDSALKTAYSIMDSWRRNYVKGNRKRSKPVARGLFLRVKQTLCRLEGDKLRITIDGKGKYVYMDLSRRHFKLPDKVSSAGIGEPVITLDKVYLPVHVKEEPKSERNVAWDSNFLSLDGYSPETGWIKIDIKALASAHISSFEKRRGVQKKASKSKKAKKTLKKYSKREMARKHQIEIARVISSISRNNGFEDLNKENMYRNSRVWNRTVSRTDWKGTG